MLTTSTQGFWTIFISQFASYASIFGLYLTIRPFTAERPPSEWFIFAVATVFAVFSIGYSLYEHFRNAPKKCKDHHDVERFMGAWVDTPGTVSIFSRDMTWANKDWIVAILEKKASASELVLHLQSETTNSKRLQAAGAKVHYYGDIDYVPGSRFTMVRYGRNDACLAIGTSVDAHTIYKFRNGHPLFALARDLTEVIRRVSKST